jgi:hypothetical protein
LAGIPLVSHVYSIDQIGRVSISVAIVSTLVVAAAWRLDIAIPIPEKETEARSLTHVALIASFISACVVSAALMTAVRIHRGIFSMTSTAEACIAGSMLLGTAVFTVGSFSLLRRKAFGQLLALTILNSGLQFLIQIGLGSLGCDRYGLQAGYALSGLTAGSLALRGSHGTRDLSASKILSKYRNFPLHSAPAAVLASLLTQVPILFSGVHYGARTAALVALTQTGLGSPLAIFSTSVTNTTLSEWGSGRAGDHVGLMLHLRKVSQVLLCVATLVACCVTAAAWGLAKSILGPDWSSLWKTVAMFAPALILQNAVSPFGVIPELLGRPIAALRRDIARTIGMFLAISVVLFTHANEHAGVGMVSAGGILSSFIYYRFSTAPIRNTYERIRKPRFRPTR